MTFLKEVYKLWNDNFNKGLSMFQLFLMGVMIVGVIQESRTLILFCMFNILIFYFQPNEHRYSLGREVSNGGK